MPAPGDSISLDGNELYFREVQLVPSYSCGPVETRLALTLLAERRLEVADLVSQRFPIDRAAEAFARAREPEGSMKVMLTFP
jgi:L-iditol 2-dehydrogenase